MTLRQVVQILLGSLILLGCGSRDAESPSRPIIPNGSPIPTVDNIASWQSIWDKRSWIVAVKGKVSPERSMIETGFRNALLKVFPKQGLLNQKFDLATLAARTSFEVLAPASGAENISGFALVRFPDAADVQGQNLAMLLSPSDKAADTLLPNIAKLQMTILQQMPDVEWVEPNLESELFEDSTYQLPPEVTDSSPGGTRIKRIRADVAWEKAINTTTGKPRYEYGKSAELNWTNVAVIDTGVDFLHKDLADTENPAQSHIFANPRETANCKDDDGNGYVDDIYGIDATLEMAEWNTKVRKTCTAGSQPIPGAADIGGPGVSCPPKTGKQDLTDKCGHGTHVAGIIAARHGGSDDAIGVCPSCRILSLRVAQIGRAGAFEVDGKIDDASQIRAISYILKLKDAKGSPYIRIVNMSLGKYFISRALGFWFRRLLENDILVVAAAGNDDTDTPNYPAAYEPVLSVCATSEPEPEGRGDYAKTGFSNFGSWVDICAPGWSIYSTVPGDRKDLKSGTSQASPFVAGAAGFLKSLYPDLTGAEIAALLMRYADAIHLYHGATSTNAMNRLYEGWFPDNTQYYLLGTGFLDLASAVTEGAACWDTANTKSCTSYVYANHRLGLESQIKGGCVVSSVASPLFSISDIMASMPLVMLQLLAVLKFVGTWRRRR